MRVTFHAVKPLAIAFLSLLVDGCSRAPSIDIDGSFLPSWMLCLLVGGAVAGLIHWQLEKRKLQHRVMPTVVFYPSLAIAASCLFWLLFFR